MSDLLQSFFLKHGIEEGETYVSFFRQWESIVGEDIAAHTAVVDVRNGALVVRVDHPAWMQVLHMRKDGVIRKVNRRFPDLAVSSIHMQLESSQGQRQKPASRPIAARTDSSEEEGDVSDMSGTRLEQLLKKLGRRIDERESSR